MILQKSFLYADLLLKKHIIIIIIIIIIINVETVVLLHIFVETVNILFFSIWWIENSKGQHLFEIEIFCNIINVFIVTFDQLQHILAE